MSTTPAVLVAAAGVAIGHAILPDHWVPLAVLGRTRNLAPARVARLAGLAGAAHVLLSLVLGGLVIVVGLQFRSLVEHAQNAIVGALLIGTGLVFACVDLIGHGSGHNHYHELHDDDAESLSPHVHDDRCDHGRDLDAGPAGVEDGRLRRVATIMVPFGAAASPDLTILPVFLAATTAGVETSIGTLVIFASVTIATIVGLTLVATLGSYRVRGQWLDRWGSGLSALVLVLVGGLVITGVV